MAALSRHPSVLVSGPWRWWPPMNLATHSSDYSSLFLALCRLLISFSALYKLLENPINSLQQVWQHLSSLIFGTFSWSRFSRFLQLLPRPSFSVTTTTYSKQRGFSAILLNGGFESSIVAAKQNPKNPLFSIFFDKKVCIQVRFNFGSVLLLVLLLVSSNNVSYLKI